MGSVEDIEAVFGRQRLATGVLHSLEEAASSEWVRVWGLPVFL